MEVFKVSERIESKIKELDKFKAVIKERTDRKAEANANYDKSLAVTMIKLKNGMVTEFEGQMLGNIPATLIEKIAKGICFNERLELEKAEAEYKSLITNIDTTCAQLNGWQSINRYLQEK